jgi:hypothetical protein
MRSRGRQPATAGDRPRVADQLDGCLLAALVAMAALVFPARGASAQIAAPAASRAPAGLELRPYIAAFVPTGLQRAVLGNAVVTGGQVGWQFHPHLAVTGAFGWAPTKSMQRVVISGRTSTSLREPLDVYAFDAAVEGRGTSIRGFAAWSTRPYLALGAGGRTYRFRTLGGADPQTNLVGYAAIGLDVNPEAHRAGLRVEARSNVSAFRGLLGEFRDAQIRSDVQLSAGLTVRFYASRPDGRAKRPPPPRP